MSRILTITLNPAVDKSASVDSLQPDKKLRCTQPVFEAGGGGVNVARAVTRLGGSSFPLYFSGGPSGKRLAGLLDKEGIEGLAVEITGETRENLNVTDGSCGRQYRFVMPGPPVTRAECAAMLNAARKTMTGKEYVVISGTSPFGVDEAFYRELADAARERRMKLVADISGEGFRHVLQAGVYLAKPNLGELAAYAGVDKLQESDAIDIARDIIRYRHCRALVISMGESGALLVTQEITERIAAPVVKRLSTVGAGDSMVAGIVLALQRGGGIPEAVRFGIACGTAATLNPGTALCKKEDAERLFQSIKH
jgi:6-phosphofructokinase 2